MKFNAGYLGVCVVVMSLFGGLILGMVLNVDSETVSTTGYKYTTDITSLFTSSDDPYYTDYNPASNYYGYTNAVLSEYSPTISGINYTISKVANNYPILVERGATSPGSSGNLNATSSYPQFTPPEGFIIAVYNADSKVNGTATFGAARVDGFKMSTLYDWINGIWGFENFEKIVINFTYPGTSAPITQAKIIDTLGLTTDGHTPSTLTINTENKTGQFVDDLGNNIVVGLYDSYICYGNAVQTETYINPTSGGGWEPVTETYDTVLSLSYTSTVTTKPTYEYMNPAGGVSLNGRVDFDNQVFPTSIWNNDTSTTDYTNGSVEIVLTGDTYDSVYMGFFTGADYIDNVEEAILTKMPGGWHLYGYNGSDSQDIGNFPALCLVASAIKSSITVYPVTKFTDFNNYERGDTPIFSWGAFSSVTHIDYIEFKKTSSQFDSLRWSVVNTKVLMDTHDSVLIDPSINLAEYWPDMTAYRYYVQSVALFGDSITINGITYPVASDNTIEINNRDFKLSNFYLSYALDNHVYISFNNQSKTIDLGEITDRTLSFAGAWFFNMGLYEGFQTTEEVYNWVPAFTGGADMLILLGLAILGITCVALVKTGHKFKMWDYIIIGAGALILLLLLGAL